MKGIYIKWLKAQITLSACCLSQQVLLHGPKGAPPAVRSFAFHACLGPATRQADVLRQCGLTQLLDAALAGFHVTIMTYGQTGSGKTFTMSGREERLEMDDYVGAPLCLTIIMHSLTRGKRNACTVSAASAAWLVQSDTIQRCSSNAHAFCSRSTPAAHIVCSRATEKNTDMPWRKAAPRQMVYAQMQISCSCCAGDSDDGIVTRAVLYLYDALQKSGKSCALRYATSLQAT